MLARTNDGAAMLDMLAGDCEWVCDAVSVGSALVQFAQVWRYSRTDTDGRVDYTSTTTVSVCCCCGPTIVEGGSIDASTGAVTHRKL